MNSNIKRTYSHFRWLCLLMFGFAAPVLTFGFVKHEVPPQQKILALTDTLYPQIEIQPDSFYLVMKPDTLAHRQLLISNTGTDTLFFNIDTNPDKINRVANGSPRSIQGSTLSCQPQGYIPGETTDFVFELTNGSPDNEWLDTLVIDFPAGVTINYASNFTGGSLGPLVYNGVTGNGVIVNWNDANGGDGNILPGETAVSIVGLTFDANLNAPLNLVYTISGDIHGGEPHTLTDTLQLLPGDIWLTATPSAAAVPPGQTKPVDLLFNSGVFTIGNHQRNFHILSNDASMPVVNVPVKLIIFPYNMQHTITIPEGWSGLSTFVLPFKDELTEIFDTTAQHIEVIFDLHGRMFYPDQQINTLENWNTFDGYIIKAKESFKIKVGGMFEISQTVFLQQGWNVMPVLSSVQASTFVVFRDLDEVIDVVHEVGGNKVYQPSQNIYTLTTLLPGKAYYIRVSEDCVVTFPSPF
ncbi:MAG TPA: hypothetical protein VFC92_05125 [Bacteroidales bacterium]|nr:hypothetical protein [Bacteroidales bacterium]